MGTVLLTHVWVFAINFDAAYVANWSRFDGWKTQGSVEAYCDPERAVICDPVPGGSVVDSGFSDEARRISCEDVVDGGGAVVAVEDRWVPRVESIRYKR